MTTDILAGAPARPARQGADAGAAARGASLRVWDLPLRLFHWLLVALVSAALATRYLGPEWWLGPHVWAGYGIAGLIALRLVWGVFGSEFSRFASFAFGPRQALAHLAGLLRGHPSRHLGHNPAGAMMIFTLIGVLVAVIATGLVVLGGAEDQGPLAGLVGYRLGAAVKDIHEALAIALLVLVALHVLGVLAESRLTGENLVRAMVGGHRRVPAGGRASPPHPARPLAALVSAAVALAAAGLVTTAVARLPRPAEPVPPANAAYGRECGDCHGAYHPSLLPANAWRGLMAGLDDHFGENASLDAGTARAITRYLTAYSAEAWDTEAANRFRLVSAAAPFRITATPYWKRAHRDIAGEVFARKSVANRGNCGACHRDAATGRFADQAIHLPEAGP